MKNLYLSGDGKKNIQRKQTSAHVAIRALLQNDQN